MGRKVQLGIYPNFGIAIDGTIPQMARIDLPGAYDAVNGTVVGDNIRSGPWRLYSTIGTVMGGTSFGSSSDEYKSFMAGHVPIVSWGSSGYDGSSYATSTGKSYYAAWRDGHFDDDFKATLARIYALPFGAAVTPVNTTTGSKLPIPGSTKGGVTPSEVVLVPLNHEPNITSKGTPAEFAAGMKHAMSVHDTWVANNGNPTVRVKFTVIISNPGSNVDNVCGGANGGDNWYGVGTANDISGASARPVDYPGWDEYFPKVEKGNGPATPGTPDGGNGNCIYFGTGFGKLNTWTYGTGAHQGNFTSQRQLIGETACRIQTAKSGDGTAINSTWPDKFWNDGTNGFTAWLNAHTLSGSGDHPLIYCCLFAAESLIKTGSANGNGTTGNIDNSIVPDTSTYTATFQNGGFSLRNSFTAWRTALVANGNETMTAGSPGVTPTGVSIVTPAAGVTSTTLSWTTNGANVTYDIYKDGTDLAHRTQAGVTGGSTTVFASSGSLPQTHTYAVGGVGTDDTHEAHISSTVSVTYSAAVGTPPLTPTGLTVSNIQQTTATASCAATANATGYTWVVDGSTTLTSSSPSIGLTGLTPGVSHSVTVAAFNASGSSAASGSVSFTTPSGPDTTKPSVPTGLAAVVSTGQVALSWGASTDPTVSGQVTSGMGTYVVQRSLSSIAGSGTTISPQSLTGTSFIDVDPPSSTDGPTTVFYTVAAVDNALNQSDFCSAVSATIPAAVTSASPTAVLSIPSSLQASQLFTADGSGSIPGTGGTIVSYKFEFGDGITVGPQAGASVVHAYPMQGQTSPQQFTVKLTVTDASGLTGIATQDVVVAPPATGTNLFPYTGAPMYAKNAKMTADVFNTVDLAQDSSLLALDGRVAANEATLAQIGNPISPRRYGNAAFVSTNPDSASASLTLNAGTLYVVRCNPSKAFSSVNWVQVAASPSAVTNAFWAVYDVSGALMSSSTATDASSQWTAQDGRTIALDGGPFTVPLGADDTTQTGVPASGELFIAFYFGTVGATHPQIACGSTAVGAPNIGTSTSAIAASQANIQTVPLFATAANTPSVNLQPPATLGNLTRLSASPLIALY